MSNHPRRLLFCLIVGSVLVSGLFFRVLQDTVLVRTQPSTKPVDGPLSDREHELLAKLLNIPVQSKPYGENHSSFLTNQTNVTEDVIPNPLPQLYPELHAKIPKTLLPQYKSPCWHYNGKLTCLPYFYLIGMPKCGTTDLWDKLVQHPQVAKVPKEPHWWAKRRNGWTKTPIHAEQVQRIRKMTKGTDDASVDWYLNWFRTFAVPSVKKNKKIVFGDGSVSTSFHALAQWRQLFPGSVDPPYNLPDLMNSVQPSAKIIAIIRDPVSRFYSAHLYNGGKNNMSCKKAAKESVACMETCLQHHTDRLKEAKRPFSIFPLKVRLLRNTILLPLFISCNQLFRGMYFIYLNDWIKAFGSTQVHVILLDDWISKPVEAYRDVIEFLELDPLSDSAIESITKTTVKNSQKKKKKKAGDLLPTSKKLLQDYYRPYNHQLADLLNSSKYLWDY
ncbi:putative carbohydrate sulfotransferase 15 isoform X1, partial [Apostichopus japonicus]